MTEPQQGSHDRQAVVLIHGIGEQRPMETLRAFVRGLGYTEFYNKPDRLSGSSELRRVTIHGTRHRPPTDFFELYWAHRFSLGSFWQTVAWAGRLVVRRPFWESPRTLRGVMLVAQATLALLVGIAVVAGATAYRKGELPNWLLVVAVLLVLLLATASRFMKKAVADASRYLTPWPRSIDGRNQIRRDGVNLLRAIHAHGDYCRIVVIGHSLGSVIGYDILRQAYDELRFPDCDAASEQPEAETFRATIDELGENPQPKTARRISRCPSSSLEGVSTRRRALARD